MSKQRKLRKKQTIIAFERSGSAANIDLDAVKISENFTSALDVCGIAEFAQSLSTCSDLRQQITLCNEFKGKFKVYLVPYKPRMMFNLWYFTVYA